MPMKKSCDKCGADVERFRDLKRVNKVHLCKDCYRKNREKFRKDVIEESGIKDELRKLTNKLKNSNRDKINQMARNRYRKEHSIPLDAPLNPKGSIIKKEATKSFITFEERKQLFGLLIRRGFCYEEATERIKSLVEFEKNIRQNMKEEQAKEKIEKTKQEMLEELWRI